MGSHLLREYFFFHMGLHTPVNRIRSGREVRVNTYIRIGGTTKSVKNLGWLLRHWKEVSRIKLIKLDQEATVIAHLSGDDIFSSDFASFEVAKGFLDRPVFRGLPIEIVL